MTEKITHLTIKGFRSLKNIERLELKAFNVLIGANGAGKSNLLEFFRMLNFAFNSTEGSLQLYLARKGRASSMLFYGPQITRFMDASIQFDGEKQWSRYDFSLSWGAPDELFFASELLAFKRERDTNTNELQLGSGHAESKVLDVANQTANQWQRTTARVFRDRLRKIRAYHFHDTSEEANMRLSQDVHREDYLMNNGGNLAAFLFGLKEKRPAHYRRILDTVQFIAPYIADFVVEPEALNDRFVMLRWKDRSGTVFGPHQLSDGTIRTIALVTALLQPDETMPSIMLFDEPELGLHPHGIRMVAELLKAASEKRQVIVATQSPLLIRDYDPADIAVVEREEDRNGRGATTVKRLDAAALEGWLEEYDLGQLYEKNVTGGGPQ
jgi:predicted ATPase